jgi:hypothetical protein
MASPGIHEFFLDEELLLFSEADANLYRLNTSAAFIWCHQAEGNSAQEISQALADIFNISPEEAEVDVLASLTEWRHLGLLGSAPALSGRKISPQEESLAIGTAIKHHTTIALPHTKVYEHRYVVAHTCFRVRFPTLMAEQTVHPILAHLEVAKTTPFDIVFDIIPDADGYLLSQDSIPIAGCQSLEQLGPIVHAELLITACKSAKCLAIIHAAAITNGHDAFLFPGDSGSGKSTLAAALLTKGYGYLSDEIGLLTPYPYRILPVPLSIGVKEGAWPVLASLHPLIKKLPTYRRLDGKKVRYLPPKRISTRLSDGHPVKRIFFPCYQTDIATQIRPISRAEALYRIAEGGYDVNRRLSATTVAELIQWISTIECYEIHYSCLTEALACIQGLLD